MIKKKKSNKREPRSKMPSPIQTMPNEMLDKIFSFLPLKYKRVGRLVCRRWLRILNYHGLVLNVQLTDKTISNAKYFTQPHLASLTIINLSQDITKMHVDSGGNGIIPPSISKLIIRDETPAKCLTNLLKYYSYSNINELVFNIFSLSFIGSTRFQEFLSSFTTWDCLKILRLSAVRNFGNISSTEKFKTHTEAIAKVLEMMSFPTLEEFSLNLDARTHFYRYINKANRRYFPLKDIYIQLATFLQKHRNYDKLKEFELKCWGQDYLDHLNYSEKLWNDPIVQFDSIRLELQEFNLNYIRGFLNTQRQVKHIELKSFRPDVIDELLATNCKNLESIGVYGLNNKFSFTYSTFTCLKFLTVGYYNMDNLEEFLNRIQTSSKASEVFSQLVTFNLIDTYYSTRSFQRAQGRYFMKPDEDRIEDVTTILEIVLTTFPDLQKLVFCIRGDKSVPSDISNVNAAAASIFKKVQNVIGESSTRSVDQYQAATCMKTNKTINLACNLILNSGKSSKQYYQRSVEVKLYQSTSRSIIIYQKSPLF